MNECAILVKNLKIRYKTEKSASVRQNLFKKREKSSGYYEAVRGVSFAVAKGEILGIIGKNGCGKSTLLKAISGIFASDEGFVETFHNKVALMAIGVGFQNELSGRTNIMLVGRLMGFSEEEINQRMDHIIEFSELGEFIDRPVKTYSSGMHSKLAFSITSEFEPDIMLLDEVLSVGDQKFRKKSLERMKELISHQDRTVIIVSHSVSTLRELCNKVMWMHDGQIVKIGTPSTVLKEYRTFMNSSEISGDG